MTMVKCEQIGQVHSRCAYKVTISISDKSCYQGEEFIKLLLQGHLRVPNPSTEKLSYKLSSLQPGCALHAVVTFRFSSGWRSCSSSTCRLPLAGSHWGDVAVMCQLRPWPLPLPLPLSALCTPAASTGLARFCYSTSATSD